MAEVKTTSPRKIIAQNLDEAKTAAYANDPQTELVILGLSDNAAVTTCGWAKRFFENRPSGFSLQPREGTVPFWGWHETTANLGPQSCQRNGLLSSGILTRY